MSQVRNVIQRDEFVTDDVGVIRLLGTYVERGTMGELLAQTYLKRKIGSSRSSTFSEVTLTQDVSQSTTGQLPDITNDNRILRHASVAALTGPPVDLAEIMVKAGICKRVTPSNAIGYSGISLQNTATLITNEAIADAADRLIWDPTLNWRRSNPPLGGAYSASTGHFRRYFVDAADIASTLAPIDYLLTQFSSGAGSHDFISTHTVVTANYETEAVSGEHFNVPSASSPTCDTLYILYSTHRNGAFEYLVDTDAAIMESVIIARAGGSMIGSIPYINNTLVTDIWDRIYAQHVVAIGFPSNATNEMALDLASWIKASNLEGLRHPSTGRIAPSVVRPIIPSTAPGGISTNVLPNQRPGIRRKADWIPHRSAISELGINQRTFYSGTDALVFVNGQFLDQATTIGHSISITSKPQFDYHRVYSRFVSRGKVAVAGVLRFPVVVPHLLQTIIKLTESKVDDFATGYPKDFINSSIAALPSTIYELRRSYTDALQGADGPDTDALNLVISQINSFNISQSLLLHIAPELANTSQTGRSVQIPIGDGSVALVDRTAISREAGFLSDTAASLSVFVGAADYVTYDPLGSAEPTMFVFSYEDVWFNDISTGFNPSANAVEAQVSFTAKLYREFRYGQDTEKELFASRVSTNASTPVLSATEIIDASLSAVGPRRNSAQSGPSHLVQNITPIASSRVHDLAPNATQPRDTVYNLMWDSTTVTNTGTADTAMAAIISKRSRYETIARIIAKQFNTTPIILPWYIIGLIHYRESSSTDFTTSIIDGIGGLDDTIKERAGTAEPIHDHANHHVNKPSAEKWEYDAAWHFIQRHNGGGEAWTLDTTWGVAKTLRYLEGWNGFGYWKHTTIYSPYLFGNTNFYTIGKWTSDGKDGFDPTATDSQQGVVAILKRLEIATISPLVQD